MPFDETALMLMFLLPEYAGVKVTARVNVRSLPEIATLLAAALIEHWLLAAVPARPGVTGARKLPVSFVR